MSEVDSELRKFVRAVDAAIEQFIRELDPSAFCGMTPMRRWRAVREASDPALRKILRADALEKVREQQRAAFAAGGDHD